MYEEYDVLVAGAGLAGSVAAYPCAKMASRHFFLRRVIFLEKNPVEEDLHLSALFCSRNTEFFQKNSLNM